MAWPVAKLDLLLIPNSIISSKSRSGSHQSIRDTTSFLPELKELIAMHSSMSAHAGELKTGTVNIIGARHDLQKELVKQVT